MLALSTNQKHIHKRENHFRSTAAKLREENRPFVDSERYSDWWLGVRIISDNILWYFLPFCWRMRGYWGNCMENVSRGVQGWKTMWSIWAVWNNFSQSQTIDNQELDLNRSTTFIHSQIFSSIQDHTSPIMAISEVQFKSFTDQK